MTVDNKIFFINCVNKETLYEKCLGFLNRLKEIFTMFEKQLWEKIKTIANPVSQCLQIGNSINFGSDNLAHCCMSINSAGIPKICEFSGGEFPLDRYLLSFKEYTIQNILKVGECLGCFMLRTGTVFTEFSFFSYISFNNFSKCHLKCTYCELGHAEWRKKMFAPYAVLPTLKDMYNRKLVRNSTLIAWGGGEPTLYEFFDETAKFCVEKNLMQNIDTNAVLYSEEIANILSQKLAYVRISVDSGTPETYKKVKGVDHFSLVWQNIGRYNKFGSITVKYVVTKDNSNSNDIFGFVENCHKAGITKIQISPELHSYYSQNKKEKEHGKSCEDFAKELYSYAASQNIKPEFLFW